MAVLVEIDKVRGENYDRSLRFKYDSTMNQIGVLVCYRLLHPCRGGITRP